MACRPHNRRECTNRPYISKASKMQINARPSKMAVIPSRLVWEGSGCTTFRARTRLRVEAPRQRPRPPRLALEAPAAAVTTAVSTIHLIADVREAGDYWHRQADRAALAPVRPDRQPSERRCPLNPTESTRPLEKTQLDRAVQISQPGTTKRSGDRRQPGRRPQSREAAGPNTGPSSASPPTAAKPSPSAATPPRPTSLPRRPAWPLAQVIWDHPEAILPDELADEPPFRSRSGLRRQGPYGGLQGLQMRSRRAGPRHQGGCPREVLHVRLRLPGVRGRTAGGVGMTQAYSEPRIRLRRPRPHGYQEDLTLPPSGPRNRGRAGAACRGQCHTRPGPRRRRAGGGAQGAGGIAH
jgi:hypothetical protein